MEMKQETIRHFTKHYSPLIIGYEMYPANPAVQIGIRGAIVQILRKSESLLHCFGLAVGVILMTCALPAAASDTAARGRVFLTFDDGPINITLDLLDELKRQDVKATFFINGMHLDGKGWENEDRAKEALRHIISEGHVVGNHSYNHMEQHRPEGIYAITATMAYRDVQTDLPYFVPINVKAVNNVLGELAARPNNRISSMARLPFANAWAFPGLRTVCAWCKATGNVFWPISAQSSEDREAIEAGRQVAETLQSQHGVNSFGWDVLWVPAEWSSSTSNETMPGAAAIEREIVAMIENGRYCEQPPQGERCRSPLRSKNVVVLLHDFLFENSLTRGRGKDANMPELAKLIEALKARGYALDTMDHYLD